MASNIVFETIDQNYPVAGVDNDTQGFRDNFGIIRNNFQSAKSEIETLQDETAKLNATNGFNGTTLEAPNLLLATQTHFSTTNLSSSVEINAGNGHYQTMGINVEALQGSSITFTLTGFPVIDTDHGFKLTVLLKGTPANDVDPIPVTFLSSGGETIKKNAAWRSLDSLTIDAVDDPVIIEFTKIGNVIYGEYKGRFEV